MTTPTGSLFNDPQAKPLSTIGLPQAGAYWLFYLTGTTTPTNVYADGLLTTPLSQVPGTTQPSCTADSAGRFNQIYLNPSTIYRVQLYNSLGVKLEDTDPYVPPGIPSSTTIGGLIFPVIAAETAVGFSAASLTLTYPYGNMLRYGIVANSTSAAAANTTIIQALFTPTVAAGPQGQFYFPNTSGSDVYSFSGVIPCRADIHIDACGCVINLGQSGSPVTGVSADSDSGLFMAANDFSFVNGTINIFWATGVSTSSGNAFWFGFRGNDSPRWPLNPVYDSLLSLSQGGFMLNDVRINSTITGANVVGSAAIALAGGLTNIDIRNIYITGSGTGGMSDGIVYEFGWATSGTVGDTGQSTRQTSHMHDAHFSNIVIANLDNVSANSNAFIITGAYSCFFENIYISGASNGIVCNPGEAQYYRPWAGVDDVGFKHAMVMRNIVVNGASAAGILVEGRSSPTTSTYLHVPWVAATVYVAGQTVRNNSNMYVTAAGGTSAGSGGPSGTGSAILDNTVTWSYVDLTKFTDLIDFSLDGFAMTCTSTGNAILSYAGYAAIRNGYLSGGASPLVISEETTRFDIDGVVIQGGNGAGIQADFTASAVWSPARLKKGVIRNCYLAGNSANTPGTFGGIQIKNFDGITIENCRFGYETAYSFIQEVTQAQAILISSTTAAANTNMRVRGCRVAGAVGNIGFANQSSTSNQGNIIENCTFNAGGTNPVSTPISGAWIADLESATAVVITNGNTITSNGLRTSRVNPGGAVTGLILQKGSYQGQQITVINESASSVTFAVVGTSFVADGASAVIAALTQKTFFWDTSTAVWYHS